MLIMHYRCPGIGTVKMTVGVKRKTHEKVRYYVAWGYEKLLAESQQFSF